MSTELRLLSICLIATSCTGLRQFPAEKLIEFDSKHRVCAEYKLVDKDKVRFVHVKDYPLNECPSVFGFTPVDIPKVIDWVDDAKAYAKANCK